MDQRQSARCGLFNPFHVVCGPGTAVPSSPADPHTGPTPLFPMCPQNLTDAEFSATIGLSPTSALIPAATDTTGVR